jgi:hypothetical protein
MSEPDPVPPVQSGYITVNDATKRDKDTLIVHHNDGLKLAPDILFPYAQGIEMLNDLGEWKYYNLYEIRDNLKLVRKIHKVMGDSE